MGAILKRVAGAVIGGVVGVLPAVPVSNRLSGLVDTLLVVVLAGLAGLFVGATFAGEKGKRDFARNLLAASLIGLLVAVILGGSLAEITGPHWWVDLRWIGMLVAPSAAAGPYGGVVMAAIARALRSGPESARGEEAQDVRVQHWLPAWLAAGGMGALLGGLLGAGTQLVVICAVLYVQGPLPYGPEYLMVPMATLVIGFVVGLLTDRFRGWVTDETGRQIMNGVAAGAIFGMVVGIVFAVVYALSEIIKLVPAYADCGELTGAAAIMAVSAAGLGIPVGLIHQVLENRWVDSSSI